MITATNPPRFLIIQTAFIGDVILATALLEQVHAAWPNAILDVLVRKGNESLLVNHPFLNDVLVWHKKKNKYRDLWRLLRTIRSRRYDVVWNLQRYATMGLLTTLSEATFTVGFDSNPLSQFFTHRVVHRFEPGLHEVDRNRNLLKILEKDNQFLNEPFARQRRFESDLENQALSRPKLYPSTTDYETVRVYQSGPYVCIAPMSVWFTKQYPAERWAELIQALPNPIKVYLLGAPSDGQACEAIATLTKRTTAVVNLAGKLTLLQSAALQQKALMNYVNDSAPLHLCSAMNAPTTAIFCSTVAEFGYGPLADQSRVVQTPELLECKPCNLHGQKACPLGHFRCAWGIRVGELARLD